MSEVTTIRLDILMQLRDDIADRTAEIEQRKADHNELLNKYDELRAENARLQQHATSMIEAMKADYNELRAALAELADLMQGVIDGDYKPDCFTLQPARRALEPKP